MSSPKSVEFNKMPAIQYNDLQFLDDVTDQNGQSVANDMTNKQRLIDFIKYGYDNFPSSKVDLDL
ncbi:hypothetical protein FACS1894166_07530 [Bacilli bacterium]|nr:hypothetical protein FACS1894166_07530 [Bacilli bacterium]